MRVRVPSTPPIRRGSLRNPGGFSIYGRGVAQPGRAPALGAGCRWFESSRPDHSSPTGKDNEINDFGAFFRSAISHPHPLFFLILPPFSNPLRGQKGRTIFQDFQSRVCFGPALALRRDSHSHARVPFAPRVGRKRAPNATRPRGPTVTRVAAVPFGTLHGRHAAPHSILANPLPFRYLPPP